jgi:hypothetical protein
MGDPATIGTLLPTMISSTKNRLGLVVRQQQRYYATRRPERPQQKIKDPLDNAPNATRFEIQDKKFTFIQRTPPSAPTPFSLTTAPASPLLNPASSSPSTAPTNALPPPLWNEPSKTHRILSEADIDQIRALRSRDPHTNTAGKLAAQFGCSSKFVAMVAPLSKDLKQDRLRLRDEEHDDARSKWGARKQLVKEIRAKRRSLW